MKKENKRVDIVDIVDKKNVNSCVNSRKVDKFFHSTLQAISSTYETVDIFS